MKAHSPSSVKSEAFFQSGSLHRSEDGDLGFFDQKLSDLVKPEDSPVYVYHRQVLKARARLFLQAARESLGENFQVHYAMKANSHPEVLKILAAEGVGMDVVSGGELAFALSLGVPAAQIIFSGVGKTIAEIRQALKAGIYQINVESLPELDRIAEISRSEGRAIRIGLRVNPNVDVKTHPHIATGLRENKFGIEMSDLPKALELFKANSQMQLQGLSLHIGSQLFDFSGVREAVQKLLLLQNEIQQKGFALTTFDVGGGVGVDYTQNGEGDVALLQKYFSVLRELLVPQGKAIAQKILFEPGRFLVARAGVLLTEVQYVKTTPYKTFIVCNTGMHQLLRPVLYEAFHRIEPLRLRAGARRAQDVVGPVCESADFLARGRELPPIEQGDWLAIAEAGAYGKVMSSQYNMFPAVREILIG